MIFWYTDISLYYFDDQPDTLLFLISYYKFQHYHQNVKISRNQSLHIVFFEQTYHHIELLLANNVYINALK